MGTLLADRAEQQADEAAVPSRSDHQQIGLDGGAHQNVRGAAFDDLAFDVDPGGVGERVSGRPFEDLLGRPALIAHASVRHRLDRADHVAVALAARIAQRPGEDGP
jgi:hypothetical protein